MTERPAGWALSLSRRSVLKQAKIRELCRAIGPLDHQDCLDIGGDNGAVSAALRQHGGRWASADVGERNVRSIREVVGGDVRSIEGTTLPFATTSFDVVVIADLLEHVEDDKSLLLECWRVLRPGGMLVANVPHLKAHSVINAIRHGIGLTDQWHGHVRPGYTAPGLQALLAPEFAVEEARTYSRAFSETIDLAMNGVFLGLTGLGGRLARRSLGEGGNSGLGSGNDAKGAVITGSDLARHGRAFGLLGLAYPFLRAFSRLDALLPFQPGYKLIVRARHVGVAR